MTTYLEHVLVAEGQRSIVWRFGGRFVALLLGGRFLLLFGSKTNVHLAHYALLVLNCLLLCLVHQNLDRLYALPVRVVGRNVQWGLAGGLFAPFANITT